MNDVFYLHQDHYNIWSLNAFATDNDKQQIYVNYGKHYQTLPNITTHINYGKHYPLTFMTATF